VAKRIEDGIKKVFPDATTVKLPVADGGEGTVEALVAATGGRLCTATVTGPLGVPVAATYGVLPDGTGVIEMAAASGLTLVPENERNPMKATTLGVGELMLEAVSRGCKSLLLGLGGSATNDGGTGMAQALGVSFKDAAGKELEPGAGGLKRLAAVDMSGISPKLSGVEIVIASDVNSPLCGPSGASLVFGPQKGADEYMAEELDSALAHLAGIIKAQLGADFANAPGAGAAGGLGYALMAFCGAKMKAGIETVMDAVGFDKHLEGCDLVITGEGRIDAQSAFGKVPVGIAGRAKRRGVPAIAITGGIGEGAQAVYSHGIDSIMCTVNAAMPLAEAVSRSGELLEDAAARAMRMIKIGINITAAGDYLR
jgi:glycerate kinase